MRACVVLASLLAFACAGVSTEATFNRVIPPLGWGPAGETEHMDKGPMPRVQQASSLCSHVLLKSNLCDSFPASRRGGYFPFAIRFASLTLSCHAPLRLRRPSNHGCDCSAGVYYSPD